MEKPVGSLLIDEFSGVISSRSPHVGPDKFLLFDNLQTLSPGILTPRKGMRAIVFSPAITPSTNDVIACYHYPTPTQDSIVWQNTNGDLQVGFSPS